MPGNRTTLSHIFDDIWNGLFAKIVGVPFSMGTTLPKWKDSPLHIAGRCLWQHNACQHGWGMPLLADSASNQPGSDCCKRHQILPHCWIWSPVETSQHQACVTMCCSIVNDSEKLSIHGLLTSQKRVNCECLRPTAGWREVGSVKSQSKNFRLKGKVLVQKSWVMQISKVR